MPDKDGLEIQETMKSLEMLWKQIVQGRREATPDGLGGFLFRLNDLLQFASEETAHKLQQILKEMKKAKKQLEETGGDFNYSLAQTILQMMHEITTPSVRIIIFHIQQE